ncbi:MAG TPA: hypothetical protein VH044_19360 [Polyangiaceae bacterium]|nr:hypothetical protein [Polyangiaceae bacterium]
MMWAAIAATWGTGCAHATPCDGLTCAAACPRDAEVDASGRCACNEGDVALLGACVPPSVADAFCGPASRVDARGGGCAFRSCGGDEVLDVASGVCTPRPALPHGGIATCPEGAVAVLENGRASCGAPQAGCPRGARPGPAGRGCMRPAICPPGTLAEGDACRPVVTTGGRAGRRVDIGAWATLALGVDGGPGVPALCQPLAGRPGVFASLAHAGGGAGGGDAQALAAEDGVRVALAILTPDEDVSRVHAEVRARGTAGRELDPAAQALVSDTVSSLLELLRGLGGEASSAAVELEVSCAVAPETGR